MCGRRYGLEDGSGNIVYDQTPYGNNGTIINGGAFTSLNSALPLCVLTNINGCDSVATLDLTINYSNTVTTSVTACDSYTWNGTTYDSSGTYSYSGEENIYAMSLDGVDDYINYGDKNEFSINHSATNNGWALSLDVEKLNR